MPWRGLLTARILLEAVTSDPAHTKQIGRWPPDTYTFTDQVKPPVADGVRAVCYHSYLHDKVLYGVLPFLPVAPWQVVLSAGAKRGPQKGVSPCNVA